MRQYVFKLALTAPNNNGYQNGYQNGSQNGNDNYNGNGSGSDDYSDDAWRGGDRMGVMNTLSAITNSSDEACREFVAKYRDAATDGEKERDQIETFP